LNLILPISNKAPDLQGLKITREFGGQDEFGTGSHLFMKKIMFQFAHRR